MPRIDAPVVDTVENIDGLLTAYQIEEEDVYVEFDAVYEETTGLTDFQWRFSYSLDSESLEEPVGDEWTGFTDRGEDFARDPYKSIVEAVETEFPDMDVEYTSVEDAVETYRELENQ